MNLDVSTQALSSHDLMFAVTANNIANVDTVQFNPSRVELEDGPGGKGVRVADVTELTRQQAAGGLADRPLGLDPRERSSQSLESGNVDLAREMVDLIQTERAYSANITTVSSLDRTTGNIINMVA